MQTSEQLNNGRSTRKPEALPDTPFILSEKSIREIVLMRKQQLAQIENFIGKKLRYHLEEKITAEEELFLRLLGQRHSLSVRLQQYTHVLDTRYFEQKLL
jgi:hypothetical protein